MTIPIPGIHHVTAVAGDPQRNFEFYTDTLGLRLVKRSVNQDDPTTYHLFYADTAGSPGTSMTFFPWSDMGPGRVGAGQVATTAFAVPAGSLNFWAERLAEHGVDVERADRFGEHVLAFEDPDGLPLELVEREDDGGTEPWGEVVSEEHAIRGFHAVTLALAETEGTAALLREMGYDEIAEEGDRRRFEAEGERGEIVDLLETGERGRQGHGTVHHVAFRTPTDADQEAWRERLIELGYRPTPVIDREWFHSVYFRTDGGILFEFATHGPGYTVDEEREELGSSLVLPPKLEDQRERIESALPPLSAD